jgi:hypothetical protein
MVMRTYKIIKKMIQSKGLSFACVALLFFSCKKSNENTDTTPPADLTVVSVTPTSGGGIISYELPPENDLLFVRADYINAQSNEVFRVSSRENNSIEISGLVDTTPLEVTLSVVDKSQNQSEGIIVSLTPKRSFIFDVIEDISLTEDLGGVRVNWESPEEKTVFIYLYIDVNGEEEVRILSSSSKTNSKFVRGLAAVPTNFSAKVEDFDGNMTVVNELGQYTPLFEEKITKDTWALVENLSINGNAYEGSTVNFWDDIVDLSTTNSDNSYFIIDRGDNGGVLRWPLDIVIDLNKTAKINRIKVWQRAFWYGRGEDPFKPYYYQAENLRSFEVYVSNDKMEWQLIGTFDIGDPKSSEGEVPIAKLEEAALGHDFILDEISPEFRYFKFSITANFGSDTFVHGSEVSLFGIDNIQ